MKTKYNQSHRKPRLFCGLLLALLLSDPSHIHGEDKASDNRTNEPNDARNSRRTEQPLEAQNTDNSVRLVGPSGEEIHDFLYPTSEDDKGVTPAN